MESVTYVATESRTHGVSYVGEEKEKRKRKKKGGTRAFRDETKQLISKPTIIDRMA